MRGFMPRVKRTSVMLATLALAVGLVGPTARAQEPAGASVNAATAQTAAVTLSTAIPYQGQLNTDGAPATGAYDFQFKLFDDASVGTQVGSTLVKEDVSVANGLFATELDFGATPFVGQARWLEIGVRAGASTDVYTTLSPRHPLLAVPYALYSLASVGNPAYGAAVGAPTNSIYVNATGKVGLSSDSPRAKLDVVDPTNDTVARFGVLNGLDARLGLASNGLATISFLSQDGNLSGTGTEDGINGIRYDRPNGWLSLRTDNKPRLTVVGNGANVTRIGIPSDGLASISFISQDGRLSGPGTEDGINGISYDRPNGWLSLRTGNQPRLTMVGNGATDTRIGIPSDGLATISFISQDGRLSGTGTEDGKQAIAFDRVNGILSLRTFNRNRLSIDQFGRVGIGTTAPATGSLLDVAGTTRTDVLVIDAGGDLAEPFDINGAETVEPGMVVAIDPDNPGQLRLATAAYDRTVAGVVSGAGGINPGLILQQEGSVAAGEHPVALSGRVYVYADATNGAIEPGDLLTTSDTPGHAMKVTDHDQAQGAILGKAMSRLAEGTGLVLVLVTLQ
jgi:hypothetical protein